MKPLFGLGLLAFMFSTSMGLAQSNTVRIGMVLEPPNLDPTSGAAASWGRSSAASRLAGSSKT